MTAPRRILVGADGSSHAEHALEWAAELAAALGAEVVAVHALGMLSHLGIPSAAVPSQQQREVVRSLLENEWSEALRASRVPHRCLLVEGNPVMALMAAADEQDADLVVVGTRGAGGFPGLQLGSTSHQLLHHLKRPVVVVPDE
ncbi:MAG: universal stress protein [Acidimicrobiales bacterium]|jgi:nucleotide-binding universal stress UspA family protein